MAAKLRNLSGRGWHWKPAEVLQYCRIVLPVLALATLGGSFLLPRPCQLMSHGREGLGCRWRGWPVLEAGLQTMLPGLHHSLQQGMRCLSAGRILTDAAGMCATAGTWRMRSMPGNVVLALLSLSCYHCSVRIVAAAQGLRTSASGYGQDWVAMHELDSHPDGAVHFGSTWGQAELRTVSSAPSASTAANRPERLPAHSMRQVRPAQR